MIISPRIIGRAEKVNFPEMGVEGVAARIDTGAKTSAVWASNIQCQDGVLSFALFDQSSSLYTGEQYTTGDFEELIVASSNGIAQHRYKVKLLVKLRGKKIRAWFTLADRSQQVYPVLIGRNVLMGKFVVDVKKGKPLHSKERERSSQLQATLRKAQTGSEE